MEAWTTFTVFFWRMQEFVLQTEQFYTNIGYHDANSHTEVGSFTAAVAYVIETHARAHTLIQ